MILPNWFFVLLSLFTPDPPENTPNDWFYRQRAYPYDTIPQSQYIIGIKQAKALAKNQYRSQAQSWQFMGPTNVGGRITDIEVNPIDEKIIYIGAASGGVFKSINGGQSWSPIFDSNPVLSIGDIAIAPSNPGTIFVGTGEPNGGGGSIAYDGNGIYKSNDGGQSWLYTGLEQSGSISKILIHPSNAQIIYASVMGTLFGKNKERGVYKSIDGGDHWEKIFYHSDSVGVIDMTMDLNRPDTIYISSWERQRRASGIDYGGPQCHIYRTFNGGKNWTLLENGLPTGSDKGRIGISVSQSEPNKIISFYVDESGDFLGVFKSTDFGSSWIKMSGKINAASFGWWFGKIQMDPTNSNTVYGLGLNGAKSTDGANQFLVMTENFGNDVHVDQHALYIFPKNPNHLLLGNDGGLYESKNAGTTWVKINNLPITQFYTCHIDNSQPQRLYGGSQDNSSIRSFDQSPGNWEIFNGGDGFVCLVDPTDNRYVYTESQFGVLVRSTNGGQSFELAINGINAPRNNWNTPVIFHPKDSRILYYGADRLYRSDNRAESWVATSLSPLTPETNLRSFGTITSISVSPIDPQIIFVGTDVGWLWMSINSGLNWTRIDAGLPERWITSVHADPFNKSKIYVTISGYRYGTSMPHVFVSENNGTLWKDISKGLPPLPCNKIIADPELPGHLVLATDAGVWQSTNDGLQWKILGNELPLMVITDIHFHRPTRKLLAATYGRGMYTYNLELPTPLPPNAYSQLNLEASPNPFAQHIQIKIKAAPQGPAELKIYSLDGKWTIQKRLNITSELQLVHISSIMQPGIYIASFSFAQGVHRSIRIVKY